MSAATTFDPRPVLWFAAGAVAGAAALALLRRQLQPADFPSLTDVLLDRNVVEGNIPESLAYLLRPTRVKRASANYREANGPRMLRSLTDVPGQVGVPGVVRIALTGGPCAGKSSALAHVLERGSALGFDVYVAPETATMLFAAGFRFPELPSAELKFTFQLSMQRLQLQLERSLTDLASATGCPSIIVFDRGLLDSKGYLDHEAWQKILDGIGAGDSNQSTGVTESYLLARYDAVVHLVTAADGAEEFYKCGWTVDDSGSQVFRREKPQEARELDARMREVWMQHPKHIIIANVQDGHIVNFRKKIDAAATAVLGIAQAMHPGCR